MHNNRHAEKSRQYRLRCVALMIHSTPCSGRLYNTVRDCGRIVPFFLRTGRYSANFTPLELETMIFVDFNVPPKLQKHPIQILFAGGV
jgi:hypothetical protein